MNEDFSNIELKVISIMSLSDNGDDEIIEMYDDNPIFDLQNFDPKYHNKEIPVGGGWIIIPTEEEGKSIIVFAKYVNSKTTHASIEFKIDKLIKEGRNADIDNANNLSSIEDLLQDSEDRLKRIDELKAENYFFKICYDVGIKPYFVQYNKTRTQTVKVRPNQYRLLNSDITTIIDASLSTDSITAKPIFTTKLDKDVIFYMQSRGIPKDRAILMSKLEQCCFIWDIGKSMQEVYQQI